MGIDYNADFGYGFVIPEAICKDMGFVEDIVYPDKELKFMFHGNALIGEMDVLVVVKDSHRSVDSRDDLKPINVAIASEVWDSWINKLKQVADELKVDKPKIGWYLCASVT
jgi:hypothetical protein